MRQTHRAGEKCFVDYCDGLSIRKPKTLEQIPTELFVGVLGASSYTYAEATLTQSLPDWLASHTRMYAFFGGVSEITVVDNLRSAVSRACKYDPVINPSYQDLATHYGTCIIPAWVRKPRHKASVEVAVLIAQRWILAVLRHQTFYSLRELNEAIGKLLIKLNQRKMQRKGESRTERYERIDQPALHPLPAQAYTFAQWKKEKLGLDYHLSFDGHFYSAPYRLAKQELWLRATEKTIEIFHKGTRVASHVRSPEKEKMSTLPEHMPENHKAYAQWSPERIKRWADKMGPSTQSVVNRIFEEKRHPQVALRLCIELLKIQKDYTEERFELACKRALQQERITVKAIKTILKNKMESAEVQHEEPISQSAPHASHSSSPASTENVRGGKYYH